MHKFSSSCGLDKHAGMRRLTLLSAANDLKSLIIFSTCAVGTKLELKDVTRRSTCGAANSNDGPTAAPLSRWKRHDGRSCRERRLHFFDQHEQRPTDARPRNEHERATAMSNKTGKKRSLNRRTFIKATAATATLFSSLKTQFPFGAQRRASGRSRSSPKPISASSRSPMPRRSLSRRKREYSPNTECRTSRCRSRRPGARPATTSCWAPKATASTARTFSRPCRTSSAAAR